MLSGRDGALATATRSSAMHFRQRGPFEIGPLFDDADTADPSSLGDVIQKHRPAAAHQVPVCFACTTTKIYPNSSQSDKMRPGQQNNNNNSNKNRSRGRNNNGGRKHLNPLSRNYESNGPDVKVRGNAAHIAEKYVQLARDAHASGDSVMAENYLQHAEHYYRIVSAAQPQVPRSDQFGQEIPLEDTDDEDFGADEQSRFDTPQFRASLQNERPYQDDRQQQPQPQGERSFDRNRDDRPREDRQQPQRDDRPRFDQQRNSEQPQLALQSAPVAAAEGEPQEAAPEVQADGVTAEGEPRRVRERRPRRRRPALAEGGPIDPNGPQPDVGDLPAFITAGGTNPAE